MKKSLMEYLLNEITVDIDPNNPESIRNVKQTINRAKQNPTRATRTQITKSKEDLATAQKAEASPTKNINIKIARVKQQLATLQQQKEQISSRQKNESLEIPDDNCVVVYTNENDEIIHEGSILSESAIQAFKRNGNVIKRQFRCTSGRKTGKIVANANDCNKRKNPKKIKAGRKSARQNKSIRIQKTRISKNKSISKMVTDLNRRIGNK